ncbi:MAG: DNA primase [Acidimicrobiia bacterium]|nr:DNA primase [Acidimicrobiia bacterium]
MHPVRRGRARLRRRRDAGRLQLGHPGHRRGGGRGRRAARPLIPAVAPAVARGPPRGRAASGGGARSADLGTGRRTSVASLSGVAILEEDVAAVKAATDIVAVVAAAGVALKRSGSQNFVGLCPFHREKTPSFSVNLAGFFHCFGCQKSGDAISFVQETDGVDFVAAVERLAAKAGVTLHYTERDEREKRTRRARLLEAMGDATTWYHERLLAAPDAARARAHLRRRGIDAEAVRHFRLGWAPDAWEELAKSLQLPRDVAKDSGLASATSRGGLVDFFRGRILFPICDVGGDPIGFGGRRLDDGQGPKYLNPGATPLYDKSRVLYGLNWAKADIVRAGEVVVCEGYTDVIGFHLAGVTRAVATCGTALTEDHVRLLVRFARRVVLAFDADAAGQAAAARFHEWEQRHDLDVVVAELPMGSDPGELSRDDPEALKKAVEAARPFMAWRLARVYAAADLGTVEGRARAANAAVAVIAGHPDPLVRDQYLLDVAARCRADIERLRSQVERPAGRPRQGPGHQAAARRHEGQRGGTLIVERDRPARPGDRAPSSPAARSASGRRSRLERDALRVAVRDPASALDWLDAVLFDNPFYAAVFAALAEHGTLEAAVAHSDEEVAGVLREVAGEAPASATVEEVFVHLSREAVVREVRRINPGRAAAEEGSANAAALALGPVQRVLTDHDASPEAQREAGVQLLTWLLDQAEERG